MPGAGLSWTSCWEGPARRPAFQPYRGKLAVRNDRGDRGNVGIIRSPVRASILPGVGCAFLAASCCTCSRPVLCRFSDAGSDDLTTCSITGVRWDWYKTDLLTR